MSRRHVTGALLIAVSLVGLAAAFLDLPVDFHLGEGSTLFLSRSAPVFWLVAVLGLVFASRLSIAPRDKVGLVLGLTGLCLVAVYLGVKYLAGRYGLPADGDEWSFLYELSHFILAPTVALAFSVVATVLGWHLLWPRSGEQ